LKVMWKSRATETSSLSSTAEPAGAEAVAPVQEAALRVAAQASYQATIGKGLIVKGKITGSESLFIDGRVEGSIELAGSRVTVGPHGEVAAAITAGEIVVLGKVCGNVAATHRVEIRAQGSLTGDVSAGRLSIEEGAFLRGRVAILGSDGEPEAEEPVESAAPSVVVHRLAQTETGNLHLHALAQSA